MVAYFILHACPWSCTSLHKEFSFLLISEKKNWSATTKVGDENWTQTFSQTFRAPPGYPGQNPGISRQTFWFRWASKDIPNLLWPLHVEATHPIRRYPDQKVWVWAPFPSLIKGKFVSAFFKLLLTLIKISPPRLFSILRVRLSGTSVWRSQSRYTMSRVECRIKFPLNQRRRAKIALHLPKSRCCTFLRTPLSHSPLIRSRQGG